MGVGFRVQDVGIGVQGLLFHRSQVRDAIIYFRTLGGVEQTEVLSVIVLVLL